MGVFFVVVVTAHHMTEKGTLKQHFDVSCFELCCLTLAAPQTGQEFGMIPFEKDCDMRVDMRLNTC